MRYNSAGIPDMREQTMSMDSDSVKLVDSQGIVVCRWKKSSRRRASYCLSTITNGNDVEVMVSKRKLKQRVVPNMIVDCNKIIHDLKRQELIRSHYPFDLKSKWWKTCFYDLLNIVVYNSYICYSSSGNKKLSLYKFKNILINHYFDKL